MRNPWRQKGSSTRMMLWSPVPINLKPTRPWSIFLCCPILQEDQRGKMGFLVDGSLKRRQSHKYPCYTWKGRMPGAKTGFADIGSCLMLAVPTIRSSSRSRSAVTAGPSKPLSGRPRVKGVPRVLKLKARFLWWRTRPEEGRRRGRLTTSAVAQAWWPQKMMKHLGTFLSRGSSSSAPSRRTWPLTSVKRLAIWTSRTLIKGHTWRC